MNRIIGSAFAAILAFTAPAAAQTFPTPLNTLAISPQASATSASSFLFTAPRKSLADITFTNGATAGFAMILDAATLPADGAIAACTSSATARPCLQWCAPMAINTTTRQQWNSPLAFTTGVLAVYSSTGCASITASATASFYGEAL